MPLFLSEEEYERCSHDASLVAKAADAFIRRLLNQLETVKAETDAASITAEQTCSLLEQRHVTLTSEVSGLQSQIAQLNASLDERGSELTEVRAQKHHIHVQSVAKDGEIQVLSTEVSELHKSKRQLMELLEQKDLEISEKNSTIKGYLDKIVSLTENASSKEASISDLESQLARSEASRARLSQEKELFERHNAWLNDELKSRLDSLMKLRKVHGELETEMSAKLADAEKRCNESAKSLAWKEDRVRELESKLNYLEQELLSSKDAAAEAEKQFSAKISTLTKLMELYKESSEEWSKKGVELEGVIKALETRLHQIENDSKERLEKEVSARKEVEKEAQSFKDKLEKCEQELEKLGKKNEQSLVSLGSFTTEQLIQPLDSSDMALDHLMLVPTIPAGVSGTALAASLLRDGWSLATMYSKYQEAVDALRHECLGRKQSQAILERVLYEIEDKAAMIMEERAEHERMVEAYSSLNQKLEHSVDEQATLQRQIQDLKVGIRRYERDNAAAESEIVDLQKQVSILLKECRDLQLRSGFVSPDNVDALVASDHGSEFVPEQLLPFKDITGLVEQNVQLRRLVRNLSEEVENRESELKEKYEKELQKHNEEAARKMEQVLARAEEQGQMIDSLHTSVAMYKKLYEEEQKSRSLSQPRLLLMEEGRRDVMDLQESSQGYSSKAQEKALDRLKQVEEELGRARNDIITIRTERDKLTFEVQLAREKLERYMKEFEHHKDEYDNIRARNVEFSQLIIDYQRKVRESSEEVKAAQEVSRSTAIEISLLKQEKEILSNSEKRALDEIRSLTERVHRLQASLDTIQSTDEIREEARRAERTKQEEYVKQAEMEWAAAKKELHEERENARNLTFERESGMASALKQVEEMRKELSDALRALAAAEARASAAEIRCTELVKLKSSIVEASEKDVAATSSDKIISDSGTAEEDVDRLREEAQVNKEHMLQYKSIAQANDAALKQLEVAHENLKAEAEEVKKLLEAELLSLGTQFHELEVKCNLKTQEIASAIASKEEAVATLSAKIASVREECSMKMSEFAVMEAQLSAVKEDLEMERQKSRATQANYERQVIMQSETIQELTRTSQTLAEVQGEASELRKLADSLKIENNELKKRLETEKSVLEVLKNDADRKYNEVNELNKILHSQLEAFNIKLAEMDRGSSGVSGGTSHGLSGGDDGLQNVVKYLRRSKEIAETEISLLKQEKLQLQSQLESALKSAETAQASLSAARANSKAFLFSEEDFKSLQLQVREINLLRESNVQLREENKHNFEECQKLRESLNTARIESQNLSKSFEEKQIEVEACKKEIEKERLEKEELGKRVAELLERCQSVDLEDYTRLRATVEQMEVNLREKEAKLEEFNKFCSEKQDVILHLELDLSKSRMELTERESRINETLQVEASLKSDIEKQRRIITQFRKKTENLSKEKEDLFKENQALSKQLEDARLAKQLEDARQAKLLEDARQAKRTVDVSGEQAMKEKEKEKDTRIHTLEKVVERLREELKKEKEELKSEKEKRQKTRKTISDSYENVALERSKLLDELDKHKSGLKMLTDEIEKLKQGKESESDVPGEINFLAGSILEDVASAYHQAVNNFERVAQPVAAGPGSSVAESSASMDISSVGTLMSEGTSAMAPSTISAASLLANVSPSKSGEIEKKPVVSKTTVEARRFGRRLVRPRITNTEDSQGDIDVSEQDAPDNSSKPSDTQANLQLSVVSTLRKRPSSSSVAEAQDMNVSGEASADVSGPILKKSKPLEAPLDVEEGQPSETGQAQSPANVEDAEAASPFNEEAMEDVIDPAGGCKENADSEPDGTETAGRQEEVTIDPSAQEEEEQKSKSLLSDETSSKPGTETGDDEQEEGELIPDVGDVEGGDNISNTMESPEAGEMQFEPADGADNPLGVDEESFNREGTPEESVNIEGTKLGEVLAPSPTDDTNENSVKANDGVEQPIVLPTKGKSDDITEIPEESAVRPDKSPTRTTGESALSKQGEPSSASSIQGDPGSIGDNEEGKQTSPANQSSTTINLHQRARERASLRQTGMFGSLTSRGRARSLVVRGRGRVGRGRGQEPHK